MRLSQIVMILSISAVLLLGTPCRAQMSGGVFICSNCSTETTALSIKVMHDLEYARQLLQYAIQVQQLADAIKNTAHGGPATLSNISMDLGMLANVVQGGRALAYSLGGQDVIFRSTFPGYLSTLGTSPRLGTYQSQYALWADTSLATTQGILRGVGIQGKLLATEQGVLSVLRTISASNLLNRNDAMNLSGQLAAEQVGQLQKLRELQLEDMTSKAAYQGYMIQQQAAAEAASERFFTFRPSVPDGMTYKAGWR